MEINKKTFILSIHSKHFYENANSSFKLRSSFHWQNSQKPQLLLYSSFYSQYFQLWASFVLWHKPWSWISETTFFVINIFFIIFLCMVYMYVYGIYIHSFCIISCMWMEEDYRGYLFFLIKKDNRNSLAWICPTPNKHCCQLFLYNRANEKGTDNK